MKNTKKKVTIDHKIANEWLNINFNYFQNESKEYANNIKESFIKMFEDSIGCSIKWKNKK